MRDWGSQQHAYTYELRSHNFLPDCMRARAGARWSFFVLLNSISIVFIVAIVHLNEKRVKRKDCIIDRCIIIFRMLFHIWHCGVLLRIGLALVFHNPFDFSAFIYVNFLPQLTSSVMGFASHSKSGCNALFNGHTSVGRTSAPLPTSKSRAINCWNVCYIKMQSPVWVGESISPYSICI